MKKVLILAYDFPPYISAGAQRPFGWYLNLKKFGYEPIVVTRQWERKFGDQRDYIVPSQSKTTQVEETEFGTLIRTPFKPNWSQRMLLKHGDSKYALIRKAFTFFYELAQYVLPVGPKKELYKGAKKYLSENQVDVIVASGEPFVLFSYASKLSKKFSVKWVADYRDPWSQAAWRRSNFIFRYWNDRFERKTLKNAAAISTVSPYVQEIIQTKISDKIPVHIQMNGYDSEDIDTINPADRPSDRLIIGFAGSIYPWHPIHSVLDTLNQSLVDNPSLNIELQLIGTNKEEFFAKYISEKCSNLKDIVKFEPRLPNSKLVNELAQCHLLLLFNDYAVIGTKIFNYIAVKRPVLLCFTECEETMELKEKHFPYEKSHFDKISLQKELLERTNAGRGVKNSVDLIQILNSYKVELDSNGNIKCESKGTEAYSRKNQIESFAKFMDTL